MSMTDDLDALRDSINSGAIADLPAKRLEEFSVILCRSQAFAHFGASEFPQICETVRAHLLRAHIETLQDHVTELHGHITDLNAKNALTQKLVIVLTVVSVIGSAIQILYAAKADERETAKTSTVAAQPQSMQLPASAPTPAKPPSNHPAVSPATGAQSKTKTP